MKSKPDIINGLNFRIIAPVVFILSLIGVGLRVFVFGALRDYQVRFINYAYLTTVLILAFAAVLLYLLLRWNINRPIGQIIRSMEKDDLPACRGTREFERLAGGIGRMRESEVKYRFLTENVTDIIWTMNLDFNWTYISPSVTRMRGYSVDEMIQMKLKDTVTPDSFRIVQRYFEEEIALESTGGGDPDRSRTLELEFIHKDGGTVWGEVTIRFLRDTDGKAIGLMGVTRDISKRKLAEDALKESEERFRTAFRTSPDSININRLEDGIYIDINEGFTGITGYSREDVLGKSSLEIDVWADPGDREKLVEGLKRTGKVENMEAIFRMKDGRLVTGLMSAKSFSLRGVPHILSVTRDINELKAAQDMLTASVEEKDLLLKEIHHRVKNNLQVISGLMNLQAHHVTDDETRNIYRESQNRVITMALIHEELYQAADLAHVDLAAYIQNLTSNLFQSYGAKQDRVKLILETEHIEMVVDTAIPCGLIINELISNSLQHAFPGGREGEIRIGFRELARGEYELTVSDNGVGLPDGFDVRETKSMGLQLVALLVDQLGGALDVSGGDGARFSMRFHEYLEAGTALY
ncbi:putative sensor histidine kinase pdtaS [bacterium BMS3Abin14]|nr:putative sensor histidine kinase pdtaS [bacterium BMS3Abin14]